MLGFKQKMYFFPLNNISLCFDFDPQTTLRSSSGRGRGRRAASSHRQTYTAKSPSSLRLRPTKTKTSQGRWKFSFRCAASQTRWRASRSPSCTFLTTRVSPERFCVTVNRFDGGKFNDLFSPSDPYEVKRKRATIKRDIGFSERPCGTGEVLTSSL